MPVSDEFRGNIVDAVPGGVRCRWLMRVRRVRMQISHEVPRDFGEIVDEVPEVCDADI